MATDAETEQGKYRRGVELHALNIAVEVQDYVDLKAIAQSSGKTMGAIVSQLIRRRVARMQRSQMDRAK